MRYFMLILVLVLFCAQAQAGEWWTDDTVTNSSWIAANALLIVDWGQTRYIADSPDHIEAGWAKNFIGENPSSSDVNLYFAASILAYNITHYFLPDEYKKWLAISVTTVQGHTVYNNYKLDVEIKF